MELFGWGTLYPEILLLVMACITALVDLGVRGTRRTPTYLLTQGTLLAAAVVAGFQAMDGETAYGFSRTVVSDPMGNWLKCFSALAMSVTLVYARSYAAVRDMMRGGELFILAMFSLLGMFVLIGGNNFIVIYLGLELLTLSSYALVALRRDDAVATEAAMKYFILGAMASGFLLYGLSMLYGATGTLEVGRVLEAIGTGAVRHQVLVFGAVFVVAGLAFKLGAAPFHMWVPDVYQGAPTAVTLIIGGATKLAAFAMAVRLLVEAMLPLAIDWQQMLAVLAVCSLLLGNLAAIAQTNLKRLLAYSTISHMGFVLLGLMSGVVRGDPAAAYNAYSSAMFYMVTYVLTTLAAFGVMLLLAREGFESENLVDFAGLNQRSPFYAAIMALCMFSMAGLPPLVGFYAKLAILQALITSGLPLYVGIAVFAMVMSLIGAFYYIRVVKVMYFDRPVQESPVVVPGEARAVLTVNGALVLLLGILPGGLMALCAQAVVRSLGP